MTKAELINELIRYKANQKSLDSILSDVEEYFVSQNSGKSLVSGSLPLPTEADASAYANGAFGYNTDADDKERGFMSGYQWTIDWINCCMENK